MIPIMGWAQLCKSNSKFVNSFGTCMMKKSHSVNMGEVMKLCISKMNVYVMVSLYVNMFI